MDRMGGRRKGEGKAMVGFAESFYVIGAKPKYPRPIPPTLPGRVRTTGTL